VRLIINDYLCALCCEACIVDPKAINLISYILSVLTLSGKNLKVGRQTNANKPLTRWMVPLGDAFLQKMLTAKDR
jgi:hypothetical protein